jgi:hypothetical protein
LLSLRGIDLDQQRRQHLADSTHLIRCPGEQSASGSWPAHRSALCDFRITALLLVGWHLTLEGFGAALPDFDYHVAIEFRTLEQDQACYDYVKKNDEPIRSLHKTMNSKVKSRSTYFFLDTYL